MAQFSAIRIKLENKKNIVLEIHQFGHSTNFEKMTSFNFSCCGTNRPIMKLRIFELSRICPLQFLFTLEKRKTLVLKEWNNCLQSYLNSNRSQNCNYLGNDAYRSNIISLTAAAGVDENENENSCCAHGFDSSVDIEIE